MNCNLLQPDLADSQAFVNLCHTYNLNQMVTQPTRITDSTEALLDIILVSNAKQVTEVKGLPSSISDHDLVYVMLRLKKQRIPTTFMTIRSFKIIPWRDLMMISYVHPGQFWKPSMIPTINFMPLICCLTRFWIDMHL